MPDYVALQEAASEFECDPATLHRYIRRGLLKRYKKALDRRTYLDREELRKLLEFRVVQDGQPEG